MSYTLYAEQESVYIGSNAMLRITLSPESHHMLVCRTHQGCAGGTTCLLNAGLNAFPVVQSRQSNINKLTLLVRRLACASSSGQVHKPQQQPTEF